MIYLCKHSRRVTPCTVVIAVNAFHAVFISITLQQSVSLALTSGIMLFDAAGNFMSFSQLYNLHVEGSRNKSMRSKRRLYRRLLLLSENVGLIEYVECLVPIVFSVISIAFYVLPNRKFVQMFHPNHYYVDNVWKSVLALLLYAWVEIIVLALFCKIVLRKINFKIWSQVGFVLHENFWFTTVLLYTWFIFSIAGTIDQLGHDWTFKFDWECYIFG